MKPSTSHPEYSGDQQLPGEVERDNDALHGNDSEHRKNKSRGDTAAQSAAREKQVKPRK
ncbi:hypothetical protein [Pseudomonas sp. dw_358]|uniref:hypothetical protein n=1 Tax=Pseudomonas sp. dw_358 TaxID=2720083 RepID=UPI001BD355F4|nr:hypothetical protein [Pseudomonas sp. dw_358]